MRSSKSRSRGSKSRNNRPSGGNIINRVFDSSGPEGKVRGTPQQIIDKYNQLHRDAQLAGDRVNAENFAQHAEHYTRMLAEAQREVDQKRDEQERQNRERQAERDRERADRLKQQEQEAGGGQPADAGEGGDSTLVETPEARDEDKEKKPAKPRRSRKPARPKGGQDGADSGDAGQGDRPRKDGRGDDGDRGDDDGDRNEAQQAAE